MKHSKQQLADIVITACEGGVNYWAMVHSYNPDNGTAKLHEFGDDDETFNVHSLNLSVIRRGLKRALDHEEEEIRKIAVLDILDAIEADIIVQLGIFNGIVYG